MILEGYWKGGNLVWEASGSVHTLCQAPSQPCHLVLLQADKLRPVRSLVQAHSVANAVESGVGEARAIRRKRVNLRMGHASWSADAGNWIGLGATANVSLLPDSFTVSHGNKRSCQR